MSAALVARCPRCGMSTTTPAERVLLVTLNDDEHVRFDCDDCGMVVRPAPFLTICRLVAQGMPAPLIDEDVVEFQVAMAQMDDLAGIAELEGAYR